MVEIIAIFFKYILSIDLSALTIIKNNMHTRVK